MYWRKFIVKVRVWACDQKRAVIQEVSPVQFKVRHQKKVDESSMEVITVFQSLDAAKKFVEELPDWPQHTPQMV